VDPTAPSWHARAACAGNGSPEWWYAESGRAETNAIFEDKAKRICADCPVRALCLTEALRTGEPYGIWGGYTPEERRAYAGRQRVSRKTHCVHGHPFTPENTITTREGWRNCRICNANGQRLRRERDRANRVASAVTA
jgi:WhiB family redox-sensing transcriptional regulator